jgi:hypothetical protein
MCILYFLTGCIVERTYIKTGLLTSIRGFLTRRNSYEASVFLFLQTSIMFLQTLISFLQAMNLI